MKEIIEATKIYFSLFANYYFLACYTFVYLGVLPMLYYLEAYMFIPFLALTPLALFPYPYMLTVPDLIDRKVKINAVKGVLHGAVLIVGLGAMIGLFSLILYASVSFAEFMGQETGLIF